MTTFTRRTLVVVPATLKAAADQYAATFDPIGYTGTYCIPLNASGLPGDATTAWACYPAMTEDTVAALLAAVPGFPGGSVWVWDVTPTFSGGAAVLLSVAGGASASAARVGQTPGVDDVLADVTLKRIVAAMP